MYGIMFRQRMPRWMSEKQQCFKIFPGKVDVMLLQRRDAKVEVERRPRKVPCVIRG
jgi:hypothetical protein